MLNDNGTVGNTMGDLRNLYKSQNKRGTFGMKHSFLPTTVAETPAASISMEDDIDVAIVKLMMSYKGYTGDDVVQQLKGRVNDLDAVKPTMFMLDMSGFFDKKTIAGEPVYTLRRGKSFADLEAVAAKTKVRPYKAPEVHVVDPKGQVKVSEGADIGIWKVTSDRKWRSVRDIISILREFGLDRNVVDARLTSMVRSNRWFDRQGTGGNTFYRLKAHIECPELETPKELLKTNFAEEAPQAATPAAVSVPNPTKLHDIVRGTQNEWTIPPEAAAAPAVVKATFKHEDIQPGDSLHEAIWKVMADRQEYTVTEITLLLADYGFTLANVSPAMSVFFQKTWATRREAKAEGQRSHYVYRLAFNEKPAFSKGARTQLAIAPTTRVSTDAQLKDTAEQFNQAPVAETAVKPEPLDQFLEQREAQRRLEATATQQPTTNETKEQNTMSKSTAAAPLLQVVEKQLKPAALLDCTIAMKGIEISIVEFGQLYKELRASGFQANRVQKASLIQANSYNIKGVEFTSAELDELVGKMNDLGIAFQKAVTL